jgi:glycine/D-amino acid oxidase-like deaminating enzyme/nitrite reductase/ring-hydroxylating ferredoxin subunit
MRDKAIANDSGASTSAWMEVEVPVYATELPRGLVADVCIIGAGIAGLSTAYHLARSGASVIVIDDGPIGGGETGRTTAHLASALDDRFVELERLHGKDGARLAAESHAAAIDDIEAIIARHGIDCDFRRVDGYLFAPPDQSRDLLRRELEAAQRAGLTVELVSRAPLTSFDSGPCLRFARQAQFHPLAYLRGLAAAVVDAGGRIHTGVRAEHIEPGHPQRVTTDLGEPILATSVVVATNAPINSRVSIPLRQAAYRTYVVAMAVPRSEVTPALYWDTLDPYHYVRLAPSPGRPDEELVIVGGEDHRTGQDQDPEARWQRLESWATSVFPMAGPTRARWSGQVLEPADGLAFIGSSGDGQFVVTGDSGNGITHGALAGILLTDLIRGRENPWAKVYDPHRTTLRAVGELVRENANTAAQYADWLSGGNVKSIDDIAPGQGAVVRRGLHLIAVYRDAGGRCHERSASCTHLAGVVRWNAAEHSWDCPCHGSRFDALGRVVNGPAMHDLSVIDDQAEVPERVDVAEETAQPAPTPRS